MGAAVRWAKAHKKKLAGAVIFAILTIAYGVAPEAATQQTLAILATLAELLGE